MLLSLMVLFALCVLPSSANTRATLFINDNAWDDDSLLPFIESGSKMLIPAIAFSAFGHISITHSDVLGSLLIKDGERYLSYNLNFGSCLDENGNVFETGIYRYGGEIYLEPYAVCEKFGLKFETAFAPDGYLAARLSDGGELLTFKELLFAYSDISEKDIPYLYNPEGKTLPGAFVHPILKLPSVVNVKPAIEALENHRATFAISPDEIWKYADMLPGIYAAGHTIAYYMDANLDTDKDKFEKEMQDANEYLFSVVGKTCRVYVSELQYDSIPKIDGYFPKHCKTHLVVGDLEDDLMVNMVLWELPAMGEFNFFMTSDKDTRQYYKSFFNKLDQYKDLSPMPLNEASSVN